MGKIKVDISSRMISALGYMPSMVPSDNSLKAGIDAQQTGEQLADALVNQDLIRANVHHPAVMDDNVKYADMVLKNTQDGTVLQFSNAFLTELGESAADGVFAPTPLISFTRNKNIKKTVVDRGDYEVIESWGCQSWDITIVGILIDMSGHWYPSGKMQQLRRLFEANCVFKVVSCQILSDLGIDALYIEKITELKQTDYNDTIKFTLIAHSIRSSEFFI